jgi:putative membrane protein
MNGSLALAFGVALVVTTAATSNAQTTSDADRTFVAMVSQGGMFEVEAGKLAETQAATQDVRDIGNTERHDHELVGAKLKAIATAAGISFGSQLNPTFQSKLEALRALSGAAFDNAFVAAMDDIHAKDGAAFATESASGSNVDLRAFAAETHTIVERHLGALHATGPEK